MLVMTVMQITVTILIAVHADVLPPSPLQPTELLNDTAAREPVRIREELLMKTKPSTEPARPGRIVHRLAAHELPPEALADVSGAGGAGSTHTGVSGGPGDTDSGFPPEHMM
jgi:hypothetical protein